MKDLKFKLIQCLSVLNTVASLIPQVIQNNPEDAPLEIIKKSIEAIEQGNKSFIEKATKTSRTAKYELILDHFDHTRATQQ